MNEVVEMSEAECRHLLEAGLVGRVAVCTPDGPHVIPVNYGLVDDTIVIRTSPYSLLGSQGRGSLLAFEVDSFDYERQRGWSVVVRGRAAVVNEAAELQHIRQVWEPRAWAAGVRNLYLRIPLGVVTGRRLGAGWEPAADTPRRGHGSPSGRGLGAGA